MAKIVSEAITPSPIRILLRRDQPGQRREKSGVFKLPSSKTLSRLFGQDDDDEDFLVDEGFKKFLLASSQDAMFSAMVSTTKRIAFFPGSCREIWNWSCRMSPKYDILLHIYYYFLWSHTWLRQPRASWISSYYCIVGCNNSNTVKMILSGMVE